MGGSITVIGLTGQTGAGKTTVCERLAERGCFIIDCDKLAREITEPGSPVLETLAAKFGDDIVRADGTLDRRLLASRAFASEDKRLLLNSITHPAITELTKKYIDRARAEGFTVAVADAAALLESEIKDLCAIIVSVVAPAGVREARIIARDKITQEHAKQRINAQHGEEYYRVNSNIIIRNYPPFMLEAELEELMAYIEKKQI